MYTGGCRTVPRKVGGVQKYFLLLWQVFFFQSFLWQVFFFQSFLWQVFFLSIIFLTVIVNYFFQSFLWQVNYSFAFNHSFDRYRHFFLSIISLRGILNHFLAILLLLFLLLVVFLKRFPCWRAQTDEKLSKAAKMKKTNEFSTNTWLLICMYKWTMAK